MYCPIVLAPTLFYGFMSKLCVIDKANLDVLYSSIFRSFKNARFKLDLQFVWGNYKQTE